MGGTHIRAETADCPGGVVGASWTDMAVVDEDVVVYDFRGSQSKQCKYVGFKL